MRVTAILVILIGLAWGTPPGTTLLSLPGTAVGGLSTAGSNWQDPIQESDSLLDSLLSSARTKFPGKAMLMSLAVPGAGQLYAHCPIKAAGFLVAEVAAVLVWRNYNQRGLDAVEAYKQFADEHWDFRKWERDETLFRGAGWDGIAIGVDGTHSLDFYVDMDNDGWAEIMGETGKDGTRFRQLINSDTSDFLYVRKNEEYYENVGKYNQFFSGWDDSDPFNPIIDATKSGLIARSGNRDAYLRRRERSNELRSTASYAVSALMFNHVLSAVDAIFSTARWNRERGLELQGSLRFDPDQNHGVGGVTLSVTW